MPWQSCLTAPEMLIRNAWRAFFVPIFHNRRGHLALSLNPPDSLCAGTSAASRITGNSVVTAFPTAQEPSQAPAKVELVPMLPGFRFLLVAIVLSMSILVFGLGAAALLRAAHEQFAGNPAWHAASRETTFAPPSEAAREGAREAARPVLALLRFDTPVVRKPSEDVPAATEQAEPMPATSGESIEIAALRPEASSLPEPAKSEIPVSERPAQPESPAKSEAATAPADTPAPVDEAKIAAAEKALPPSNEAAPAAEAVPAMERANPAATSDTDVASTKIATLDSPPVSIEPEPSAKAAAAKQDASLIKQRLRARRAALRRRLAARARLAAQQALLLQQQQQQLFANPFAPRLIR
jgi:outer membrane biosynthesis protein TonB